MAELLMLAPGTRAFWQSVTAFFADASSCIDNFSSKKPEKSWSVKDGKTHHEYWKSNAILPEEGNG